MELTIELKTVDAAPSTDGAFVRWEFTGHRGEVVTVVMRATSEREVIHHLAADAVQRAAESALPSSPETDTNERLAEGAPAMLVVTELNIVRFDAGGTVLRIRTSQGATLDLGLTPDKAAFLIDTMTRSLGSH